MNTILNKEPEKNIQNIDNIKYNTIYVVGLNICLFVAGVIFIKSPLMDMLVPKL